MGTLADKGPDSRWTSPWIPVGGLDPLGPPISFHGAHGVPRAFQFGEFRHPDPPPGAHSAESI